MLSSCGNAVWRIANQEVIRNGDPISHRASNDSVSDARRQYIGPIRNGLDRYADGSGSFCVGPEKGDGFCFQHRMQS